ncbi:MAG: hypothetical protein ABEJ31_14580 [Haloarculaceae archaeon]
MADSRLVPCPNERCDAHLPYLRAQCPECGERTDWREIVACRRCGERYEYFSHDECINCGAQTSFWYLVTKRVLERPAGSELLVAKDALSHPATFGGGDRLAAPGGAAADFRFSPDDRSGVYVTEYDDCYGVRWREPRRRRRPLAHLRTDARQWGPVLAAVGAWVLSLWLGRRRS